MELYLLRHGIAEDGGPAGDAARALTEQGAARMREAARGMGQLGMELDLVLASPLVRARQTAEIVARELGLEVREAAALSPGCDLERLRAALAPFGPAERVLVVGHEPDLSAMIGALTGGSVRMKKGGLCRVDSATLAANAGEIIWLLPPRALRQLG